jgi:exopolyphosphatase/guanosine-5'-triphosphate,3'-diphosphate pyrophosphatase
VYGVKKSLRLASIDIGTNSTRLLVADCDGERTVTLDRRMTITRLGQGVDETRRLSPAAMERTEAALRTCRAVIDVLHPRGVRAAATSVLRDSENGREFLDSAGAIIGRRPEVLSGEFEARLSYAGAVSDLRDNVVSGGVLVFDIGGGSTELIVGQLYTRGSPRENGSTASSDAGSGWRSARVRVVSVDVGCVRMSERFLSTDPPSPAALSQMESYITGQLEPALDKLLAQPVSCAVGLAGTVTTLSGIKLGLHEYDTERIHHSSLSRLDVEGIYRRLASVNVEERKRLMGLEPGRADIIVGGAAVLLAIMELAGLEEILVSEKDILDGLVLDLYRDSVA